MTAMRKIDGVPGTASPVELQFMDTVGGVTGAMFPTGSRTDRIDGVDVTCMDVAMPMVIARAEAFGLTGHESAAELDENREFFERMEAIRLAAARRMGMGDASKSVTPKFGLLASAEAGGSAATPLFHAVEHASEPCRDRVAMHVRLPAVPRNGGERDSSRRLPSAPARLALEHPMGQLNVRDRLFTGWRSIRAKLGRACPNGAQTGRRPRSSCRRKSGAGLIRIPDGDRDQSATCHTPGDDHDLSGLPGRGDREARGPRGSSSRPKSAATQRQWQGCDAQFNHLVGMRGSISEALTALERPQFVPTPRTLEPPVDAS